MYKFSPVKLAKESLFLFDEFLFLLLLFSSSLSLLLTLNSSHKYFLFHFSLCPFLQYLLLDTIKDVNKLLFTDIVLEELNYILRMLFYPYKFTVLFIGVSSVS